MNIFFKEHFVLLSFQINDNLFSLNFQNKYVSYSEELDDIYSSLNRD